jgi:hypothetical protein
MTRHPRYLLSNAAGRAGAILCAALLGLWILPARTAGTESAVQFVDIAARAGITFQHDNASSADKYLIETMGAGAAWLDYDNDGYVDLYLANSAPTKVYKPARPLTGALYRNNGDGTFTDVTAKSGAGAPGLFGMGVAAGDYDNDGFPDLYVAGYGRSILYRNNGDGTFSDVTERARVANSGMWASSAAWFDYDRDGRLDLVIANYLDFTPEKNLICVENGHRSYCHPNKYHGQRPVLYHNNGNGTFSDVSRSSGIGAVAGNGLGVVTFDFNGDGWPDIFIANDSMQNFLFVSHGGVKFEEAGVESGVAFSEDGKAEAGMGVDAADYDRDGRLDLFVTHLDLELNRLYRNRGDGTFEDATFGSKIGSRNFRMSGFGTRFIDYDNDGWPDLFIANGHVLDNIELFHKETAYAETKTMYRNVSGKFEDVTASLGPDMQAPRVSRATALADFDNDGDIDILVTNNGQAPQLLENAGGNRNHWIELRLYGTRSSRDGIGARITLKAGGVTLVDEAKGGMSYQSSHDPRLHFGLGAAARIDSIEVRWPSGVVDRLSGLAADRIVGVKEGAGETATPYRPFQTRAQRRSEH